MFSANSSQVSDSKLFVEDVFSTYLYTGTGAAQTINNGIDLTGKGGLVWLKMRSPGSGFTTTQSHGLFDTVRGDDKYLSSDLTNGQSTFPNNGISFNSSGFGIDAASYFGGSGDQSTSNFASWTFREAPKFFDIVTYTGNGNASQTISHNLGTEPGCIIVKRLDATSDWSVYHRGNPSPNSSVLALNTTAAKSTYGSVAIWNPTATTFTADRDYGNTNSGGGTYVAYLFAHDATADGLIQCGSFTTNGSGTASVTLGWEPQWLIGKTTSGGPWFIADVMRNMSTGSTANLLANSANAEGTSTPAVYVPTATGFNAGNLNASQTYIYIAIRRGPMRTPTLGTSVYNTALGTASSTVPTYSSGFPVDFAFDAMPAGFSNKSAGTRLLGARQLLLNETNAESGNSNFVFGSNVGWAVNYESGNRSWMFRRAPGFMDVVCYTGNGVNGRTINHNLGVTPELMIMKNRSSAGYNWFTWDKSADLSQANALLALSNAAGRPAFSSGNLNSTVPTSTVFTIGGDSNASGGNYVTYLFASAPGVSKVGSYTGNGSSQTINCGFAAGARFVMIKRTDSTGDWYVWDSARGIVAGNDPHLSLNGIQPQVTTDDSVDTDSSGFIVNQDAATNVNVSSATYIYLAIA